MTGIHHVIIETSRLKYEFDIKRNISVIQGDSATGKTTLIDLLQAHSRQGDKSGIMLQSDVPCVVFAGDEEHWEQQLDAYNSSIIFFDEDYRFIHTESFASHIRGTDNYYVFVTRRSLKNLPYSIKEIYGIRTSGKYHFPEQIYHEFYPLYGEEVYQSSRGRKVLLIEDEKSGFQFFERTCNGVTCISAMGNSNILPMLTSSDEDNQIIVIADGAAFGAYIDMIVKHIGEHGNVGLYLPESFEWLILRSGIISDSGIDEILEHPEDYIESSRYFSWERYFTDLLENNTGNDPRKRYSKDRLANYYTSEYAAGKILDVLPANVKEFITK